jgi:integrase/recombinase XerD
MARRHVISEYPKAAGPHVDAFTEMLAAERGAAVNTISAYTRDILDFATYLDGAGRTLADAGSADLRGYLGQLNTSGRGARTAARRLSAFRQFYRFLFADGVRHDDPTAGIDSPRQGRSLPRTLSEEDVEALFRAARARQDRNALRLRVLLEIIYATGLRVSELVGLPLSARAGTRLALDVPLGRCRRPPHTPALRANTEGSRRGSRARPARGLAPCVAPCICQPSVGPWCGSA